VPGSLVGDLFVDEGISMNAEDPRESARATWSRSDRLVPRTIVRPAQEFLRTSSASALLLLVAVVAALGWANSPWAASYERLWSTILRLRVGWFVLDGDLHFWVNDALMALFFLVVGLEIKREVVSGELRQMRAAALPVAAAVGGMVVPAIVYLLIAGSTASRGWGVPMATDIAFALGVLAMVQAHASPHLKPILLSLAIVDDIGAILVIAVFYTGGLDGRWIATGFVVMAAIMACERLHVRAPAPYVVLGVALWYATYRAGIHPTIAGVALGVATPARPFQPPGAVSQEARRTADATGDGPDPDGSDALRWLRLAWLSREAVSPLARIEHALLPWTTFVIVPLFALANAGVEISWGAIRNAATGAVSIGIFAGLVIGKPLGVAVGALIGMRSGVATPPAGVGWGALVGMGATAGVGFTVALFVAELAFTDAALLDQAKIAILLASLVAAGLGYLTLRWARAA
jgi:NhaA family Na+:H+ antiporter